MLFKKMMLILIGLLLCQTVQAGVGTYRIVEINDQNLVDRIAIKRNFQNIAVTSLDQMKQPLYPGDLVRVSHDYLTLRLLTPTGDTVWLSGMQEVRLPNETGTWWNVKNAIFQVSHPVQLELMGVSIRAESAKFRVFVDESDAVRVEVMHGDVDVTSFHRGFVSRSVSASQFIQVRPNQEVPQPQPLQANQSQPPNPVRDSAVASLGNSGASRPSSGPSSGAIEVQPSDYYDWRNDTLAETQRDTSTVRGSADLAEYKPITQRQRPNPLNIPPVNGGQKSWFSRMVSSKWFIVGTGLVTGGVVAAAVANSDGGNSTDNGGDTSVSDLPGPPNPGGGGQ